MTKFDLSGFDKPWKDPAVARPGTHVQPIATDRGTQPYRLTKWKGEPGIYESPNGLPWSEIYVVYAGRGRVRMNGTTAEIGPGSVIEVLKGIPCILEIDETLEKMAVINP